MLSHCPAVKSSGKHVFNHQDFSRFMPSLQIPYLQPSVPHYTKVLFPRSLQLTNRFHLKLFICWVHCLHVLSFKAHCILLVAVQQQFAPFAEHSCHCPSSVRDRHLKICDYFCRPLRLLPFLESVVSRVDTSFSNTLLCPFFSRMTVLESWFWQLGQAQICLQH